MSIALAQGRKKTRYGAADFSVCFDPDMAEHIRVFAIKKRLSFGEAVRTLCEWGLETERQADV